MRELGFGSNAVGFAVLTDDGNFFADEFSGFVCARSFWGQGDGNVFAVSIGNDNGFSFGGIGLELAGIRDFLAAGCIGVERERCDGE